MSERWFKASTRWHLAGDFDRSLCGRFDVPESTQPDMGGRPCAPCSLAEVAEQEAAEHAAWQATLTPRAIAPRPLTVEEQETAHALANIAHTRKQTSQETRRWA